MKKLSDSEEARIEMEIKYPHIDPKILKHIKTYNQEDKLENGWVVVYLFDNRLDRIGEVGNILYYEWGTPVDEVQMHQEAVMGLNQKLGMMLYAIYHNGKSVDFGVRTSYEVRIKQGE